jgi:DNA polymerase-3 subunit epsilon
MKGFLDIETGGFSITKNGVCEIALVAVDDSLNVVDTFHRLIKPYTREDDTDELVSYKDDSMAINGLTVEKLISEGLHVGKVMIELEWFMLKHGINELVGHNSRVFDIPRVQYLMNRFNKNYAHVEYLDHDTMLMAKSTLNLPSYKLADLCTHFGIINTNAHSAVGDALATLDLYKKLIA